MTEENIREIQYRHISDAAIFARGCRLMNTQHSVCGFEGDCLLHMAYLPTWVTRAFSNNLSGR